jgi:hypothetical protein
MSVPRSLLPLGLLALVAASGCGGARFVSVTPNGGVVAVPSNTNSWPFHYRDSAEKLMAEKCPNGYVIDKEEAVVVGQKTVHRENSDTNVTDVPGQKKRPPSTLTRSATTDVTETVDQTEWRITFHAKEPR